MDKNSIIVVVERDNVYWWVPCEARIRSRDKALVVMPKEPVRVAEKVDGKVFWWVWWLN